MNRRKFFVFALGATAASSLPLFSRPVPYWPDHRDDDDHDDHHDGRGKHDDRHDNGNHYGQYKHDSDYRFRGNDYVELRKQYRGPRKFKGARPRFERGQYLSNDWRSRMRPVPVVVIRQLPPPPPGYQFGYIDGYAVCYNPTTRVIADVLDIVNAVTR
jgi:Ni/Co efflux regulator RcnB